jgi:histidinol dehydrogenase
MNDRLKLEIERISDLGAERRRAILRRSMADVSDVFEAVKKTVDDIRARGDAVAVDHYRKLKDDIKASDFRVTRAEIEAAYEAVDPKVVDCLRVAAGNITRFHQAQVENRSWQIEVVPGIVAGRMVRPLDVAGCYVPGRRAIYPSSVLMTILPAKVAGVSEVVVCTPPDDGLVASPATLVACDIAGVENIFKIGGPWAVGAMAFGTPTVPRVDKIVGPGNRYVTAAKMAVFGFVDIDSPAGPSESLVLCDDTPNPAWVALDLLSQVEHDPDAAAVLVTTSERLAKAVLDEIETKLPQLPRREILIEALSRHSALLVADDLEQAVAFTNEYASEHLQIMTADPFITLQGIRHAGSIFLGPYAPVPVGDYASGTNHVLPTGQAARMFSGLSVDDFIKKPTYQYLSRDGLASLADVVTTLARAENLPIHALAVEARFKT